MHTEEIDTVDLAVPPIGQGEGRRTRRLAAVLAVLGIGVGIAGTAIGAGHVGSAASTPRTGPPQTQLAPFVTTVTDTSSEATGSADG